jgi:hypothetical protein
MPTPTLQDSSRTPLRLRLRDLPGRARIDGGWWPQSRDLAVELADLVDHFPEDHGRVVRALFSPPDWETPPRRVPVARGYVKVGSFPRDDTHLIHLRLSDATTVHLLVVPAGLSRPRGNAALRAAAVSGGNETAAELLEWGRGDDREQPAPEVGSDHWTDGGGAYWDPHPVPPSYRTPE